LVAMGFSEDAATAALAAAGGDLNGAVEALTEGATGTTARKPPAKRGRPPGAKRVRVDAVQQVHEPVARPVDRKKSALATLSNNVKEAIVSALAGPDGARRSMVVSSIAKGRVSLRHNTWADSPDDARLKELSPAYGRLKAYQQAGVRWMLALDNYGIGGILADEMGLGKTAETLTFLDLRSRLSSQSPEEEEDADAEDDEEELPEPSDLRPCLVVCPLTLLDTWESEAKNWCPHFRIFRYYGSTEKEREPLAGQYFADFHGACHLVLTTPAVLHNKAERYQFFRKVRFDTMVYDEAHSLRNAGTARFSDVHRGLRVGRRLLLTGTPVQNSLQELGNLLSLLLAPSKVQKSTEDYEGAEDSDEEKGQAVAEKMDVCKKGPSHRLMAKATSELVELVEQGKISLRTVQARAAPLILRRLKRDVIKELPPKTGHTVKCKLSERQRELYDMELARTRKEVSGTLPATSGSKSRASAAKVAKQQRDFVQALFHRLRRLCNHPLMTQSKLEEQDYERLVELMQDVRPDFRKATVERARAELSGYSDFDVVSVFQEYRFQNRLGPGFDLARFQASDKELQEDSCKIRELLRILKEQRAVKRKSLVFSQFTQFLDVISRAVQVAGYRFVRLDGRSSVEERQQMVRSFQDEDSGLEVFLLSTKAGGTGLNLTAADCVVMMDLCFNPQDNRQAEDRVHRLGQTRPVNIHYLIAEGTIEEAILRSNLEKMKLDYQFGGQKFILDEATAAAGGVSSGSSPAKQINVDEDGQEDDEEPGDDGEANAKEVAKLAEQSALAELTRLACGPGNQLVIA